MPASQDFTQFTQTKGRYMFKTCNLFPFLPRKGRGPWNSHEYQYKQQWGGEKMICNYMYQSVHQSKNGELHLYKKHWIKSLQFSPWRIWMMKLKIKYQGPCISFTKTFQMRKNWLKKMIMKCLHHKTFHSSPKQRVEIRWWLVIFVPFPRERNMTLKHTWKVYTLNAQSAGKGWNLLKSWVNMWRSMN